MQGRFGGFCCPRRGPICFDGDVVHPNLVLARIRAVVARLPAGHRMLCVTTRSRGCRELLVGWAHEVEAPHTVHGLQDGGWQIDVFLLPDELGGISTPTRHERIGNRREAAAA
jgi:hypothetical protein